MFINLSNHPSAGWPESEIAAATAWGEVTDIPFPAIRAESPEEEISRLAAGYLARIPADGSSAVMVTGEYSLVYALVDALLEKECRVVCPEAEVSVSVTRGKGGVSERKLNYDFRRFVEYQRYPGDTEPVRIKQPVFLNCSMHYASSTWDERARTLAERFGRVMEFPITPLSGSDGDRIEKAARYLEEIDRIRPAAVLLDGEFFTFYMMANALLRKGLTVLVKCSDRNTVEKKEPDGTVVKITQYRFVRYRRIVGGVFLNR